MGYYWPDNSLSAFMVILSRNSPALGLTTFEQLTLMRGLKESEVKGTILMVLLEGK